MSVAWHSFSIGSSLLIVEMLHSFVSPVSADDFPHTSAQLIDPGAMVRAVSSVGPGQLEFELCNVLIDKLNALEQAQPGWICREIIIELKYQINEQCGSAYLLRCPP